MNLTIVAGARPNFIKIAPILHSLIKAKQEGKLFHFRLVHTGQHYDESMSGSFFIQLQIPNPDINLKCGGGTQAEQTAAIMIAFEKDLLLHPCDYVLVVGDVTSTMACAIVAKKLNTKVIHIEAGIRSFDLSMPEEINRIVTDRLSDLFFTTSKIANSNLRNEGVSDRNIYFVGNVMIDTLLAQKAFFEKPFFLDVKNIKVKKYIVITLHRPSNVDNALKLKKILEVIVNNTNNLPIIFPIHPRTAKVITELKISAKNLILVKPMSYLEFNWLVENSLAVITDSGGITEETTVMGIPCITLRNTTERPETVSLGTNELIGEDIDNIISTLQKLFAGKWKSGIIPEKWDGHASERIIEVLSNLSL